MTVRIRHPHLEIDNRRLAAILTPALLSPAKDDAPQAKGRKPGIAWLQWGDANQRECAHLD
jgi:hypothetical protein